MVTRCCITNSTLFSSTPALIKQRLRERALQLGVHAFGVTAPHVDEQTQSRLIESVQRGDLLSWGYDDAWANTASDPAAHLADAQSVICIAVAYAHPAPVLPLRAGRVAAYAWGQVDYHEHLRAILDELAAYLVQIAGEYSCVVICDTRPLAERAVAQRAGLGWVGKHTNLIVPGTGSYVFLGEIVTSFALPFDEPLKKNCGSCTRCVTVCPTNALRGDFTMDAQRCISDLTQRRGSIPREMRPLLGTWIWGCDLCQEVCPPTMRGKAQVDARFAPHEGGYPDLLELLVLTNAEFESRFKATAMGWRGAALLRRNAAIALGNTLDRASVHLLSERLSTEPSAMVREHIAWALGRISSPSATHALRNALEDEKNQAVRTELYASLGRPM